MLRRYWDIVQLNKASMEATPTFSLLGLKCVGRVLQVYDGDTLWLAVAYPEHKVFKYRVRLYGYDAPEMHPLRAHDHRDEEIEAAKKAKKYLEQLLPESHIVDVEFFAYDKYGRPLVNLTVPGQTETINDQMVKNGYGYAYFGGKKEPLAFPLNQNGAEEEKNHASRSI